MVYEVGDDALMRAQEKLLKGADKLERFGVDPDDRKEVESFKRYMTAASIFCTAAFLGAMECSKVMGEAEDEDDFEERLAKCVALTAVSCMAEMDRIVEMSEELVDDKIDFAVMRAKGVPVGDLGDLFAKAVSNATGIPVDMVREAKICAFDSRSGESVSIEEVVGGMTTGGAEGAVDGDGFFDGVMELMKEKGEEE